LAEPGQRAVAGSLADIRIVTLAWLLVIGPTVIWKASVY